MNNPASILYDADGHPVAIALDGEIYRLQTDSKIAKGSSDLVHLDAVDTVSGKGRLKATLYTAEGEAVTFGAVPPNPSSIANAFVKNSSDEESLLVDGETTPVVYTYPAHPTYDVSVQGIKFVMAANSITFGKNYFGAIGGPLENGLLVQIRAGGNLGTIFNLKQNECFVNFSSPGGFQWVVSSKDMMSSSYVIGGGLKLGAGTTDKITVTVQDDIHSAGIYFQCFVKGNLLPTG